jgi:sarcosine oxidase subunit beta
MTSFDVAIVGAGVHGASAAYNLTQRGVRVVVFERTVPAGGPTGRSSAVVRAYYTNRFLAEVARDSIRMFTDFADLTGGGDSGFRRVGGAFLHTADDREQSRTVVRELKALDIMAEWIRADALSGVLPGFVCDDVAVAVWEPDAGYADPAGTTLGLMSKAVKAGAVLHSHSPVQLLQPHSEHVVLTTDTDTFRADRA